MENKKLREDFEELKKRFEEELKKAQKENDRLKDEVKILKEKRVSQTMIMPFAVKQRAMGEPNKYINGGLTASLPTTGEEMTYGSEVFYDYTAKKLYIWNSEDDGWDEVSFS